MCAIVTVETQGISDNWSVADGDYDPISRGPLTHEQVTLALYHAAHLAEPVGDDPYPPHVQTDGPAGQVSFVGQQGSLFCPEADMALQHDVGADLAFGKVKVEQIAATQATIGSPPPPISQPRPGSSKAAAAAGVLGMVAGAALGGGIAGGADGARLAATGAVAGAASDVDGPVRVKRRFTWRTWIGLILGGGFCSWV